MNTLRTRIFTTLIVFAALGVLVTLLAPRAKSAGGAVPVQVTGTVATTRLDDPDSQPFEQGFQFTLPAGYGQVTIAVPAGKRLVIDSVSGVAYIPTGAGIQFIVQSYLNGLECESRLPMTSQGAFFGGVAMATSSPVKIYADASSTVTLTGFCNSTATGSSMTIGVYGHFINYP